MKKKTPPPLTPSMIAHDVPEEYLVAALDLMDDDEEGRREMAKLLQRVWEDGNSNGFDDGYDDGASQADDGDDES